MRAVRFFPVAAIAVLLLACNAPAGAASEKVDPTMKQVLGEYLKVHRALAADKEAGVSAAAAAIDKLAAKLEGGAKDGPRKQLAAQLRKGAAKLKQARGLSQQREAFKELSKPLVTWARQTKPHGVKIVHCSMAKASWVQTEAEVRNPYYGSKMLTCGEVAAGDEKGGHEHHHHPM